jgi:hypothetical protein
VDLCDLDRGDLARTAPRRRSHSTTAGARLTVCTVGPVGRNSSWTVAPPVRRTRDHPSPGRLPDRRSHRGHQRSLGDGQPRRLPDGRHHGRALARRALRAYSPTAGPLHPTDHLRARPTDHRNDAGTTGDNDPAITGSIAVFDGLRTTDADRRSFTSVHNTKRPPAHAGGRLTWSEQLSLVAGTESAPINTSPGAPIPPPVPPSASSTSSAAAWFDWRRFT